MNLSAPKNVTFYIAMLLGVLGILGSLVQLGGISTYATWLLIVGFVILALGNMMENF
jgi:cytochrome c oxidase subunit IV